MPGSKQMKAEAPRESQKPHRSDDGGVEMVSHLKSEDMRLSPTWSFFIWYSHILLGRGTETPIPTGARSHQPSEFSTCWLLSAPPSPLQGGAARGRQGIAPLLGGGQGIGRFADLLADYGHIRAPAKRPAQVSSVSAAELINVAFNLKNFGVN